MIDRVIPIAATEGGLASLTDSYHPPAGRFDEWRSADGGFRPAWQRLADAAPGLTREFLGHAARQSAHLVHENGVTYNAYDAAAAGTARPWHLDVLPALLDQDDWNTLAGGLRQRARLLNALAADLYGPQDALNDRWLPASLVLNHPGFLRACHGATPAGGTPLLVVAFDLARAPDGGWIVTASRTQAPSGLGYALANRAITTRLFPDAARTLGAQSLAPFCDALQDALLTNAPVDNDTPSAVLLTPGRYSETYFEHVYLARELGVPLVQGGDLTVRRDRVFLKTVTGLQPVHAIWRRVDDDYCDPLELRADSTLGVPGLVQAWRSGRVLMANAFGLRVLESPALAAYLPALCRRFLGEPLALPSIPTMWCADSPAGSFGPDAVIRSAWSSNSTAPRVLSALSEADRDSLIARVAEAPEAFVRQSFVPLSHAPVWREDTIVSRAVTLRVFLVADGHGDYQLMPGGLCRVAGEDSDAASSRRGGGSKDTWVLSPRPLESAASDPSPARTAFAHGERLTTSRAAENLFWLGRYAERSENGARLLRAVLRRAARAESWPEGFGSVLARTGFRHDLLLEADLPGIDEPTPDAMAAMTRALMDGVVDREQRRSLRFNVEETVRVAESVRDRLSSDNWRVLQHLSERVAVPPGTALDLNDTLQFIDEVILGLVAAGGLEMAHMTRDEGWRFLSLGRHLERLMFVASTLRIVEGEHATSEPMVLEWLLDLSDSLMTYRARHLRRPEWTAVADLLYFDERNPRAALFQVAKLEKHVQRLPDAQMFDVVDLMDRVQIAALRRADDHPALFDADGAAGWLPETCEQLAFALSDALTLRYFSHIYDRPQPVVTR